MIHVAILVAFVIGLGPTEAAPQNRPDFSGRWTLVKNVLGSEAVGVFGETFVATQYSASLIVDWAFVARGRGGNLEQRPAHSAFIFDGTESNVSDLHAGSSHTQIADTSMWDGQKLVITTTWRGTGVSYVSRKRVVWLESDGTLVVETSTPPERGGPRSSTQSRYRRVRTGGSF